MTDDTIQPNARNRPEPMTSEPPVKEAQELPTSAAAPAAQPTAPGRRPLFRS